MDLSDVYARQVKKIPVVGSRGSFGLPPVEKDPTINQLEIDVFAKIQELDKIDHPTPIPEPNPSNSMEIKTFSYEDALRELIDIKNKNKSQ